MQGKTITEIKEEIDRPWEEVLKMREETGICQDSPQKQRALSLMKKLFRNGKEERQWVLEKMIKIRWKLAKINEAEGKLKEATDQLEKIPGILDRHPEIKQSLGNWIEIDLKKIERRCQDGNNSK